MHKKIYKVLEKMLKLKDVEIMELKETVKHLGGSIKTVGTEEKLNLSKSCCEEMVGLEKRRQEIRRWRDMALGGRRHHQKK
jgi:hypothetical protein